MVGLSVHTCRQVENPRNPGFCACGKPVEPKPTSRPRNLEFERQAFAHVAKGACDPEPMFEMARSRCIAAGYSLDTLRVGPDWLREFREEAADGGNYLVWWMEENLQHPDREHAEMALRYLLLAFDCARRIDGD